MKILGVSGSLRKESFNTRLLAAVRALAPDGMTIDVYGGLGDLPPFNEDLDSRQGVGPEPVNRWRQAVHEADALLIVSPEYNNSVPGGLKNAIDWASCPSMNAPLHAKTVAIMGATTGRGLGRNALADLCRVLHDCHAHVVGGPWVVVSEAEGRLPDVRDARGRLAPAIADPVTARIATAQLASLAAAVEAAAGEHAVTPLRVFMEAGRPGGV